MVKNSDIHLGILYIGKQGGICHYTYELVRVISRIVRVTCYLSANNVLLDKWHELPCQIKTFDTYDSLTSLLWSMLNQQQLMNVTKEIQKDRPDILLETGSGPWAGAIKKALLSKPSKPLLVDVIHDVEIHPDRWLPLLKIYKFLYPTNVDAVVGISEYSCNQVVLKFPNVPIIKSAHGIIHPSSSIDPDKIAKSRNKFLFFGRIERYKGIEVLVESFRIAKQACPDISLSIVGNGLIDDMLTKKILDLDIQLINRWISEDELLEVIESHGVIVMPYLSATQSGVAAVALGNGLPAIATNVGALPEQIVHGQNGIIVPRGDADALSKAMIEISKDYALAYKMSQEACLIAESEYSWDKIAVNLLEDLTHLAQKS